MLGITKGICYFFCSGSNFVRDSKEIFSKNHKLNVKRWECMKHNEGTLLAKKGSEFFCSMPIPIKLCGLTFLNNESLFQVSKTSSSGSAYLPKPMTTESIIPTLYMSELRNCLYSLSLVS